MLKKIILATIVAVVAWLVCTFVGGLFVTMSVPIAVTVGGFLVKYATVIAILTGLWYFFTGFANPFTKT